MKRFVTALAALALPAALCLWPSGSQAQNAAGGWGTIKGQVIYAGDQAPAPMELKVDKDQAHCLANDKKLFDETWVVNKKNKGVRYVFIWLEDPADPKSPLPIHPKLKDLPKEPPEMDQPQCQFVPHALAMRAGQVLLAKNSSPIQHNFNYGGHPLVNPGGNFLMPPKCKPIPTNVLKADRLPITVQCNIHGWMKAWVRVFDHPYYAVTDEDGKFEIPLAPAGSYQVKVWLGGYGWMGRNEKKATVAVTVPADGVADLGQLKIGPRP
jgi:hypothetical protein